MHFQQMALELLEAYERFSTLAARTALPHSAVSPEVDSQVSGSFEPHAAVGAIEKFLARVDVQMLLEVAEAREAFATVWADVRPFFGVLLLVVLQLKIAGECFGTLGTLQGFANLIRQHVNLQLSHLSKRFSAVCPFGGNWTVRALRKREEMFFT